MHEDKLYIDQDGNLRSGINRQIVGGLKSSRPEESLTVYAVKWGNTACIICTYQGRRR